MRITPNGVRKAIMIVFSILMVLAVFAGEFLQAIYAVLFLILMEIEKTNRILKNEP